ncbi:tRNA pseudouridine(38-40) synthase [hydrothermal vent metagenome]|uniref:tRNA pseudouridine(38-40) synthase n=1 Tax=hydrothermal vent metagenome TaxID=652676 RepID=A0A3B0QZ73_9ZZZZ
MRNIKLTIEYDGTNYSGWQIQPDSPTIQGALEAAVRMIIAYKISSDNTPSDLSYDGIHGASRTDAGVHAFAHVATFKTDSLIPVDGLRRGLNSILPGDIAVKDAALVPADFDARRHSKGKTYLYKVLTGPTRSPVYRNRCWYLRESLDLELMQEGAKLLVGEKDFSSFRASGCGAKHPIREVTSFTVEAGDDGFIEFTVRGTAFLRHMVRIMVGTLVELGKGKVTINEFKDIIEAKKRTAAPYTAPPQGLFLMKTEY